MAKRSKDLLQLEHKELTSAKESALLVCKHNSKSQQQLRDPNPNPTPQHKPFIFPLPKSQVLGKVKDFIGALAESNKDLQLKAKTNPNDYNIETLTGAESEYIEMDLMLGVADLHTPEAVLAAESAVAGNQQFISLPINDDSSTNSEDSSSDNDNEEEEEEEEADDGEKKMDDDGDSKSSSPLKSGKLKSQEKKLDCQRKKRSKIVELS